MEKPGWHKAGHIAVLKHNFSKPAHNSTLNFLLNKLWTILLNCFLALDLHRFIKYWSWYLFFLLKILFFSSWSFVHLCNGIEYGPCIEYVDDPPPLKNCSKLQNEGKVWEDSALLSGGWIIIGCLSLVGFTSLEVVKPIKSFKVMQRATKSQRPRGFQSYWSILQSFLTALFCTISTIQS